MREFEKSIDVMPLAKLIARGNQTVTHFKDGVAVIDVAWHRMFRENLEKALAIADAGLGSAGDQRSLGYDSDPGVDIRTLRDIFAQGFAYLIGMYKRLYSCAFYRPHLGEIQRLLKLLHDRAVQDEFSSHNFSSLCVTLSSLDELRAMITRLFDTWGYFTLPYLAFTVSWRHPLQMLWSMPPVDKGDVAFHVYYLSTRDNLAEKETGVARGVLFSVEWMDELLCWLSDFGDAASPPAGHSSQATPTHTQDECLSLSPPLPPPGPFSILHLVKIDAERPGEHMVYENDEMVDTIPEALFDYLWSLFGGGPKHLVMGAFRSRHAIAKRLAPQRVTIAILIKGLNGWRGLEEARIVLPNVLHRARLFEVMRRALCEMLEQFQDKGDCEMNLFPALCVQGGFRVFAARLPGRELGEGRLPLGAAITVAELLQGSYEEVENLTVNLESELQLQPALSCSAFQDATVRPGLCGLPNIGNTCYMNSALQCLISLSDVRRSLFGIKLSEYVNPSIATEFVNLFCSMLSGQDFAETRLLKSAIGNVEKRFDTFDQQDAAEFIEVLLDRLHEEMNSVAGKHYRSRLDEDKHIPRGTLSEIFWNDFFENNKSFIPKLFFHQSVNCLVCSTCGERSIVFDNNPTLSATIATSKRRLFEVDVLLPGDDVEKLYIKVNCDVHDRVYTADIEREVCEQLRIIGKAPPTTMNNAEGAETGQACSSGQSFPRKPDLGDMSITLLHHPDKFVSEERYLLYAAVLERGEGSGESDGRVPVCLSGSRETYAGVSSAACVVLADDEQREAEGWGNEVNYLWYFLQISESAGYTQRLCCVERMPAIDLNDGRAFAAHVFGQGRALFERFINGTDQQSGTNVEFLKKKDERQVPDTFKPLTAVFYSHLDDCGLVLAEEVIFNDNNNKWNVSIKLTPESHIVLKYSDCTLPLSDAIRGTSPHPVGDTTVNSYYGNHYCNSYRKNREAVSVEECLTSTFSSDTLSGTDALYCGKCATFRDGRVDRRLFRLPPCLIISLKRFKLQSHEMIKNSSLVTFDEFLDLGDFLDKESPEKQTKYKLVGVVFHRGALSFGHYTAARYVKHIKQWLHCDDRFVSFRHQGPWLWPCAGDAYILCYERCGADDSTME
uniref:Uncharacterized protein TCIL3000_11_16020 n=1 Tax=Trypanosoma congolense (strain IL3000) TaxID=1068625 RepID=G0V369_TRYCI|nr:unnamed protein product [Trypanosoma congolense IL3000]